MRERRGEQQRARAGVGEHGAGALDDLGVVLELERRGDRAGADDAAQVVVPRQPLVVGEVPVRDPVETGGVDVRHRPLLEPVQLVGADEMHLPDEHGAIAEGAQDVRERRHRRRHLAGVVDRAGVRRKQTREHRGARRHAQGRRAQRALEHDAVVGEAREVRRADDTVAVRGQRARRELVGDDEQDVRAGVHAQAGAYAT
jgi:hypothetical protein